MKELLEVLEAAPNVRSVSYDTEKKVWTIKYKTNLEPDVMISEFLIEFIMCV